MPVEIHDGVKVTDGATQLYNTTAYPGVQVKPLVGLNYKLKLTGNPSDFGIVIGASARSGALGPQAEARAGVGKLRTPGGAQILLTANGGVYWLDSQGRARPGVGAELEAELPLDAAQRKYLFASLKALYLAPINSDNSASIGNRNLEQDETFAGDLLVGVRVLFGKNFYMSGALGAEARYTSSTRVIVKDRVEVTDEDSVKVVPKVTLNAGVAF